MKKVLVTGSEDLIGFEEKNTLSEMLDIVIPWVKTAKEKGLY